MSISDLQKIVSKDSFFEDPETLRSYSKDESFVPPIRPRCVVKWYSDCGHLEKHGGGTGSR